MKVEMLVGGFSLLLHLKISHCCKSKETSRSTWFHFVGYNIVHEYFYKIKKKKTNM